jgi:hypothetical protein
LPDIVAKMHSAVAEDLNSSPNALATAIIYRDLPKIDFSSQILQGAEAQLRLIEADRCGWSDLGTPKRLGETLRALPQLGEALRGPQVLNAGSAVDDGRRIFERWAT